METICARVSSQETWKWEDSVDHDDDGTNCAKNAESNPEFNLCRFVLFQHAHLHYDPYKSRNPPLSSIHPLTTRVPSQIPPPVPHSAPLTRTPPPPPGPYPSPLEPAHH
ncbi:hypothetical protein AMAG_20143 [Allomyces macrogynus ATCC 38327]|uniref:Uncharacterized protein n=1 Tax=Allomyces macrogynus (strain ATCC 38327) TaxID=578462 RepID=A0A0L0T5B9_ALLM3|nr:hypothetical protein AMAG_20143 [Allomyces macrogynus ATCC 38327]|eukprot:KNE69945.1 hypothetical protein AMAG_20143 [Allomyces macrogynus ATCC 38327]